MAAWKVKRAWTHLPTKKVRPDFDPLTIPRDQRKDYRYEGPGYLHLLGLARALSQGDGLRSSHAD